MASFRALDIPEQVITILGENGYKEPSEVQLSVIPRALRGESILAQSPTGSGKTHSFLIPIISRVDPSLGRLQAIIIAPTRELARQTYLFAEPFNKGIEGLRIRLYSGENERAGNLEGLASSSPQVAIGTPGRLLDLLSSGVLSPKYVKTVVLDEADMLLDMGFFDECASIMEKLENPQTLVFSATLKERLKSALSKFVKASFSFEGGVEKTAGEVKHVFVDSRHQDRYQAAVRLFKNKKPFFGILFVSKREEAPIAHRALKEAGFDCVVYSGDLSERERKKTMKAIRENKYQIIVASDLLARGIDLPDVDMVVSLDLPNELDFYFHRAGRTGRFGKIGESYLFYDSDDASRTSMLLEQCSPKFMTLKGDRLVDDPVGLLPKKKLNKTKKYGDDEQREIAIVKAKHSGKKVKPGYKKKKQADIDKVKRKYRKKAIRENIRKNLGKAKK